MCVEAKIRQEEWVYKHRKVHKYVAKYLAFSNLLDFLHCPTMVKRLELLYAPLSP